MAIYSQYSQQRTGVGGIELNTLSLAHFNGTDGATTTSDDIAGITWNLSGGPTLETTGPKFGSAYLKVTSVGAGIMTGLTSPHLGSWTVESFIRVNGTTSEARILGNRVTISINGQDDLIFFEARDVNDAAIISESVVATINLDTWYHLALVRDVVAGTYAAYFEGNRSALVTSSTNAGTFDTDTNLDERFEDFAGYDEFRISKNVRYTGTTYTIPTAAFVAD